MEKNLKKINTLMKKIANIKEKISSTGDLRKGSLTKQYNICGTPNCKCKASVPEKHGPYYQLSFTNNGKSSTKFVHKENANIVDSQVKGYTRLKELIKEWVELGTELSDLRLSMQED